MARRRGEPPPDVLESLDAMLRQRGRNRKCQTHPKRPVTLGVVWADGRAITFKCGLRCLEAWKKTVGRMACVVRVIEL
jgi:hypothetical protein